MKVDEKQNDWCAHLAEAVSLCPPYEAFDFLIRVQVNTNDASRRFEGHLNFDQLRLILFIIFRDMRVISTSYLS